MRFNSYWDHDPSKVMEIIIDNPDMLDQLPRAESHPIRDTRRISARTERENAPPALRHMVSDCP